MKTPRAPGSTQSMKLRSKWRKEATSVGRCPFCSAGCAVDRSPSADPNVARLYINKALAQHRPRHDDVGLDLAFRSQGGGAALSEQSLDADGVATVAARGGQPLHALVALQEGHPPPQRPAVLPRQRLSVEAEDQQGARVQRHRARQDLE